MIVKNHSKKHFTLRWIERNWTLIISITWLVVLFWSISYLFGKGNYYSLVINCLIVIISVLISWFFLKDLVAGIIFRGQNRYTPGDYVQFGELEGKVESFSLTHISVNTKDGKLLKLPYSRLNNQVISQKSDLKSFQKYTFVLTTNKKEERKMTESSILTFLMVSPWRSGKMVPEVKFNEENDQGYLFEIQIQLRNPNHFIYLKESLEKRFGK